MGREQGPERYPNAVARWRLRPSQRGRQAVGAAGRRLRVAGCVFRPRRTLIPVAFGTLRNPAATLRGLKHSNRPKPSFLNADEGLWRTRQSVRARSDGFGGGLNEIHFAAGMRSTGGL